MKKISERLVEEVKDGYEVYEVVYLERRMTKEHWDKIQDDLDNRYKQLKKSGVL